MLSWWESSMRSCSGLVRSWGVLWWCMRRMCRTLGSNLGVLLCRDVVGSW